MLKTSEGLSERYERALVYATHIHAAQRRKGTDIPYLSHLLAVSALVMEHADPKSEEFEHLAIAALLHDAAEDQGGEKRLCDIKGRFGERVAEIVRACSDLMTEDAGVKAPWVERKRKHLDHLRKSKDLGYHLVAVADKLHNARAILTDFRTEGERVWERFECNATKSPGMIVGYYQALSEAFLALLGQPQPLARELRDVVACLVSESNVKPNRSWETASEGEPSMKSPVYSLTVGKTYFDQGFFNLGVEVDRFVRPETGPAVLYLGESRIRVDVEVNRTANVNGTPRVMGGVETRNWIQRNLRQGEIVEVHILAPDELWLRRV